MATVSIPLAGLGVDLADIRRLQVIPPLGLAQRVFIDEIGLVKP
jgi:hypothetical protein